MVELMPGRESNLKKDQIFLNGQILSLPKSKLGELALYILLPRPGAILGGSIYFWGGVVYAAATSGYSSVADIIVAWFCVEFLINQAKYWLNDFRDVASDKFHPRKRTRVSVSGYLPIKWLPILCALRVTIGIGILSCLLPRAIPFALFLPVVQLGYDSAKKIPLLNAGVATWGSVLRFIVGYSAVAGGVPPFFSCLLVYCQRLAIYTAAYSAEARYLLRLGITTGKEYTLFYARHPYIEKVAMAIFLGLLAFAFKQFVPGGAIVTGLVLTLCGSLYYRINGPGDSIYWEGWRIMYRVPVLAVKNLRQRLKLPLGRKGLCLKNG